MVYGGDNSSEIGVRLAIPNKLYESIFYGVPLLCRTNTQVGAMALELGVGLVLDDKEFTETLLSVGRVQIREMEKNCHEVPTKRLVDSGEEVLREMSKTLRLGPNDHELW